MAFKLVKRNKLRVPVKGTISGEDGKPVNFSFVLLCNRLTQTEIDDAVKNKDETVSDFIQRVTNGWEDILAEDGTPVPFDTDALAGILAEQPGLHVVCYQAYLKEIGATAKN